MKADRVPVVSQLQAKLSHFDSQRAEIVERLHDVMETQWKEALRVISGGSIPSRTSSDLGTMGQGKCELPKQPPIDSEEHRKHTSYAVQFAQQAITASKSWDVPPLSLHVHQQSAGSSTTDDHPFCHEGQSTYRVGVAPDNSSGKLNSPLGNPGDELKRYIRMSVVLSMTTVDSTAQTSWSSSKSVILSMASVYPTTQTSWSSCS
uniref:Uncharacterized protein n=1 Tax=Timema monikensis TaxID=170555 RepID=A0A7R9E2N7_9NEOP|nr:unnamed protein product [Timema monikensis]